MAEQFNRDELQRQTAAPADASDEEEGVRRLMRQLLNTSPQPRKAAKGTGSGRRGRPAKRREE